MIRKLYKVMTVTGRNPVYYSTRAEAKVDRDERNKNGAASLVCRGPEHRLGETYNISKNMPKQGEPKMKRGW